MDFQTFFSRFGGSARTKNIKSNRWKQARSLAGKRAFALPAESELPKEFIRLCPWEIEYLFTIARRARKGILGDGTVQWRQLVPHGLRGANRNAATQHRFCTAKRCSNRRTHCQTPPPCESRPYRWRFQKTTYPHIGDVDVLFIDGDHTYDGCMNDLVNWYGKLVVNGHLVLHDSYLGRHGVQDAIIDFMDRHAELEIVQSPFIGANYWHYPAGSIAHFIKRERGKAFQHDCSFNA